MLKILNFLVKELSKYHKIDMKNHEMCGEVQAQADSFKT